MSDTSTHTTETTTERKPPTLADIVREKTDDGKRIIDFFLDVMEDRIDGAELCHRIDAAKQLEKHKSKAAAKFLAKYRGVSCGHSINGRPNPADPCSAAERSLVAVTLNAPATLTKDFLAVLSGIDEFLMARLIRAQTADGVTVIEFLDDVMQDRNDGFKCHHRIAAAKELIVHIARDEQPVAGSVHPEPVEGSVHPEPVEGSVHPELVEGSVHPEPVEGSAHPEPVEGSAHPEPVEGPDLAKRHEANSTPTPPEPAPAKAGGPAKSLPRTRYGAGTHPPLPITPITQIPLITVQTLPLPALCGEISLLTTTHPSSIIERMSDTSTHTTETTTERKPPTLADIVREKTDDGRLIIDFFTDVMMGRIDGAELCHRMDAAKQLEKHKSKAAAKFLAKYRGVSCGHSTGGRPDPADPCSAEERSLVAVTLNAPATLTRDFLTVLSGIDEFLMARLIRAQTADGVTVIEFLDDVMQDRNDGFKTHHRIAAAKELIVHIVRDEQPEPTPREPVPEQSGIPAKSLPRTRYGAGTQGGGGGRSTAANSARTEPVLSTVEGSAHPEPGSPEPVERVEGSELVAGSVHPEPRQIVIPAESLPRTRYGAGTHPPDPGSPEPVERAQGPQDHKVRRTGRRRTRTQRRRDGNARAAILGKGSERNKEEKQDKPAPAELTIAERRIKEKLERHWHEPDPWAGPIDSTHPGRSPPW